MNKIDNNFIRKMDLILIYDDDLSCSLVTLENQDAFF